jgi:uncharacterized protein
MHRLVIASMRKSAGKTSMVVGLGRALGKKIAYLKPFGDRLLYRKKRLWDYDAALVQNIFSLQDNPEDLSIGFDHSKLSFMYDEQGTREKLAELMAGAEGHDTLFIEAGRSLAFGGSVYLDAVSLARHTGARLVIVVSGDEGVILDDATFIKRHLHLEGIEFAGIIINKVQDLDDFKNTYASRVRDLGIPILGMVPHRSELTHLSLGFLAESLFAKVIAGEKGLERVVRNVFVGAMSTDAAMRNPLFGKEGKLVITSGDRSDMILAALEGDTVGVVLTNNIFPPSNIISRAAANQTPLMMVAADTYQVAKQIDDIERLLTASEVDKISLLAELAGKHIDAGALLG